MKNHNRGESSLKKIFFFSEQAANVNSARSRQDQFSLKFVGQADTPCLTYSLQRQTYQLQYRDFFRFFIETLFLINIEYRDNPNPNPSCSNMFQAVFEGKNVSSIF